MKPKVSICMPTYNYAKYLPEAIESVLEQDYSDYEFIIIDDCSKDNSFEIISQYASQDKRIIFRRNEQNIGMVNNWNLCLQNARGEYIKYLFGDDKFASRDVLRLMVSLLDNNKDVSLVASARYLIDERSNVVGVWSEFKGNIVYDGKKIIRECLIRNSNMIGEPSVVMFRRGMAARGFNNQYKQLVDWEMWYHILEQGNFIYIKEPLCAFRVHSAQQTKMNRDALVKLYEPYQLYREYSSREYVKMTKMQHKAVLFKIAYDIWKLNKKKKITRSTALDAIRKFYSVKLFFILLPFYKVKKFFRRTINSIVKLIMANHKIKKQLN